MFLTNKGRRNLYALFAEMGLNFVYPGGRIGLVLPSGIVTDKPNEDICKYLVKNKMIGELIDFENHGIFPAIHNQYRFCLLTISLDGNINYPIYGFLLRKVSERTMPNKIWSISSEEIDRISPTRFSIPCFSSSLDAELAKRIYKSGITLSEIQRKFGAYIISALVLNYDDKSKAMKNEISKIVLEENGGDQFESRWLRVYEGEYFHSFDHRYATYQGSSLTLPCIECRGFFLQPGGLPNEDCSPSRRGLLSRSVRFSSLEEKPVPLCPRVQSKQSSTRRTRPSGRQA